ncbi:MAG TPA: hypothetical protein VE054_06335, partial [Blattabacteriaceae bacterium]|nr:hypothetical protein [Blattabacteriaceae bacterium]
IPPRALHKSDISGSHGDLLIRQRLYSTNLTLITIEVCGTRQQVTVVTLLLHDLELRGLANGDATAQNRYLAVETVFVDED